MLAHQGLASPCTVHRLPVSSRELVSALCASLIGRLILTTLPLTIPCRAIRCPEFCHMGTWLPAEVGGEGRGLQPSIMHAGGLTICCHCRAIAGHVSSLCGQSRSRQRQVGRIQSHQLLSWCPLLPAEWAHAGGQSWEDTNRCSSSRLQHYRVQLYPVYGRAGI